MKHFSTLQIVALAVLTVIVVALAIVAFATGKNLAADRRGKASDHPQRWNCFGRVDYGRKATFR